MVILNGMVNTKFLYFENRPESLRLSVSHFWPPALGRLTASFSWDASETGRCASAGITSIIEKDRDQLQVDTEHVASVPSRIWPLEFRDFILWYYNLSWSREETLQSLLTPVIKMWSVSKNEAFIHLACFYRHFLYILFCSLRSPLRPDLMCNRPVNEEMSLSIKLNTQQPACFVIRVENNLSSMTFKKQVIVAAALKTARWLLHYRSKQRRGWFLGEPLVKLTG